MRKLLAFSVLLCSGCSLVPQRQVILDPQTPHEIAQRVTIPVWATLPDGTKIKTEEEYLPGDYAAHRSVMDH
jgi:hypothetical protein